MTFTIPSTLVVRRMRWPSGSYVVWNGWAPMPFVSATIFRLL